MREAGVAGQTPPDVFEVLFPATIAGEGAAEPGFGGGPISDSDLGDIDSVPELSKLY